jgi:hypothetical protein
MEASTKRNVKDGKQYDVLFPRAEDKVMTVKRNADVNNTLEFIPKVVRSTSNHTEKIAERLRGKTLRDTCKNIWNFVYDHIAYEKDEKGKEQVRSPAKVWADRKQGVDCDCYTTFISSILYNLNIPHIYRITKYGNDYFQHIYPIVPTDDGNYITIDCVVNQFDYEEPYTEKLDKKMDLQYLYGIESEDFSGYSSWDDDLGDLGENDSDDLSGKKVNKGKVKGIIKKVAHVTNRANPATLLLRNGLLASMKLNLMKVAGKLRWAYLTEAQAKAKGISPDKYQKLRKVLTKMEEIFYGAGGKKENLKKAILTSRGNKDKAINGLGEIDFSSSNPNFNEYTPLPALLGHDVFDSENRIDNGELGELGEPVTAASIAAATGALATVAKILKNIGDIFPKGNKLNDSGNEEGSTTETVDIDTSVNDTPSPILKSVSSSTSSDSSTDTPDGQQGFWDKNKGWLKPTLIGTGILGVIFIGYKAIHSQKTETKKSSLNGFEDEKEAELNGVKRRKSSNTRRKQRKTPIALM